MPCSTPNIHHKPHRFLTTRDGRRAISRKSAAKASQLLAGSGIVAAQPRLLRSEAQLPLPAMTKPSAGTETISASCDQSPTSASASLRMSRDAHACDAHRLISATQDASHPSPASNISRDSHGSLTSFSRAPHLVKIRGVVSKLCPDHPENSPKSVWKPVRTQRVSPVTAVR